ncbi:ImmA/IrrE family metallo-endopeptidase [Corynebacterium pyruviciproducens]|uniref:ImmA/IrrE family metallo-endopeptidase n=1 Tax=Corynebacterium pyruviciproducens TaxID=598660 RepID=UPI0023F4459A|nr:ImmA/IrrE family metallo-endopeptidase [Corynebacterium pyruviciproducens]
MGVAVVETPELSEDVNAVYIDAEFMILIRSGLDPWTRRSCLAHELAHAYFRDEVSEPRIERRADQWAAQLLISPAEYRAAELLVGAHVGALAYELEVTPAVVETWRACYRSQVHV